MIEIQGITPTGKGLSLALCLSIFSTYKARSVNGAPDDNSEGYKKSLSFAYAIHEVAALYPNRFKLHERTDQHDGGQNWHDEFSIIIEGDDPTPFAGILTDIKRFYDEKKLKRMQEPQLVFPEETEILKQIFRYA